MPAPLSRLRELFILVAEAPAQDRPRLLDEHCAGDEGLRAELLALLTEHDTASGFLAEPTLRTDEGVAGDPLAWLSQRDIGPYHLLERIGEGGWGEVFMADQREPVRRRVALKILKPGMDSRQIIERFAAERQTLAMMDHPGIARVFDAGTTPQGRPFFVMELVDGVPISDYCARHAVSGEERLRLFTEVCRAVQHAHSKGIIHRDLKPSNILVTQTDGRPAPKVIDFGIAKATSGTDERFTHVRQLVGTPAYMSPEQASLSGAELDTRSDIYSLGVVLYELLTGATPFDAVRLRRAALAEMHRIIAEEPPPRPSEMWRRTGLMEKHEARTPVPFRPSRFFSSDIDWIILKALEKEPARRYETAAAFAEDILRHLAHEPVSAGPPSALYRFRKFARRNRRTVAAACVALGGLVAGLVFALAEARARRIQAERAESLLRLQSQIFETANPESARGEDYTVRELLNDFSAQFQQQLDVEPDVEISLRQTLGRAFQALARGKQSQTDKVAELEKSDLQVAESHFRAALVLAEKAHGPGSMEAAACRHDLGWVLRDQGRYLEARPELELAVRVRTRDAGTRDPLTLASRAFLADVLLKLNDSAAALTAARGAVQWPDHAGAEAIRPLQSAAQVCMEGGDLDAAAQAALRAVDLARKADGGSEAARSVLPLQTLALVRLREGRNEEAAALAQRAVTAAGRIFGAEHRVTINAKSVLTDITRAAQPASAVLQERRDLFDSLRQTLGEEHPETFDNFVQLLSSVISSNPDSARDFVFSLIGTSSAERDAGEPIPANSMNQWAQNIITRGNIGDYEAVMTKALAIVRRAFGDSHRNTLDVERGLAFIFRQQKKWPEAAAIYQNSFAQSAKAYGENSALACEALILLAETWQQAKRFGDMERTLTGLRERILSRQLEDAGRARQLQWLGAIYHEDQRHAEALELWRETAASFRRLNAKPDTVASAMIYEGAALRDTGLTTASVQKFRELMEYSLAEWGESNQRTWLMAARYAGALRNSLRWRDAIPLVDDYIRRASASLPQEDSALRELEKIRAWLAGNLTRRTAQLSAAGTEWEAAVGKHGSASAEAMEKLRAVAIARGNAGDYAAVRRALADYSTGMAALPDVSPPDKDDPAVLAAWFDYFFAEQPDAAADERIISEAVQRLAPEHAGTPGAARILQRAAMFYRDHPRREEFFRLLHGFEDRRTDSVWPAEKVLTLVPREAVWSWSAPGSAPDSAWHRDAAFDDNSWPRGGAPLGGRAQITRTGIDRAGTDDATRPLLFRHVFRAPEKASRKLKLRIRVVDGCIVWLNGREVLRENVKPGDWFTAAADAPANSPRYVTTVIDLSVLRPGDNVLAAAAFTVAQRNGLSGFVLDAVLESLME